MIPATHPQPHRGPALALTVLMHALLVGVLFFGVQWKRNAPESVDVELWSARPQVAQQAPPPPPEVKPEPKPEPRIEPKPVEKPDIAIAKDKKPPKPEIKKPEPPKPEPKKPEATKPESKKPETPAVPSWQADLAKEYKQRDASRLAAEAGQEQRTAASQRGLASWGDKIKGKIRGNIFSPPNLQGNPAAIFHVTQLPTGEIIKVELKRASGNPAWDSAVERAIYKSSPLPKPDDAKLFDRELNLTLCPDEQRGCR